MHSSLRFRFKFAARYHGRSLSNLPRTLACEIRLKFTVHASVRDLRDLIQICRALVMLQSFTQLSLSEGSTGKFKWGIRARCHVLAESAHAEVSFNFPSPYQKMFDLCGCPECEYLSES